MGATSGTVTSGNVTSRDGTRIAYDATGGGPPLVVVDGATMFRTNNPHSAELAGLLTDALPGACTVVRYDRRGRGDSTDTPPPGVDREVEDVAAVLEAFGGSGTLLGFSSGAFLALHAAARGVPASRLALYEAPYDIAGGEPSFDPAQVEGVEARVAAGDPGGAVEVFLRIVGLPDDVITAMRTSPGWQVLESVAPTIAYDGRVMREVTQGPQALVGRLARITQPTLVLDGDASFPFMAAAQDSLARALPDARRVTLPGEGHDPDPAALAPALVGFLRAERW